jgi:hypothetical protein
MNWPPHYLQETVTWHPDVPGRIMPDVKFNCVTTGTEQAGQNVTLLLLGFGEGDASGANGVSALEQRGRWAAATDLPFGALSPEAADLERIAVEGPRFLAEYYGRGRPVDVVTNSLSALAMFAVIEAPELFRSIRSLAPFPLVNEHLGRIPFMGSNALTRRAAVGYRLGVQTPLQLWRHVVFDGNVRGVGTKAIGELRRFGDGRNPMTDHAFAPGTGQRVADSAVRLMLSHEFVAAFGDSDRLVRHPEGRASLRRAAERNSMEPTLVDERVIVVKGPHAPLCSREGLGQLLDTIDYGPPARVADASRSAARNGSRKKLAA